MAAKQEIITEGELLRLEGRETRPEDDILGDMDDEISATLNNLKNEFGASNDETKVQLKFYRVKIETGARAFLFNMYNPAREYNDYVGRIQKEYGTGTYECHFYINGRMRSKERFEVETPRVNTEIATKDNDTAGLLQIFMNEARQSRAEMRELIASMNRPEPAKENTLEMLKTAAEIMKPNAGGGFMGLLDNKTFSAILTPIALKLVDRFMERNENNPFAALEQAMGFLEKAQGLGGGGDGKEPSMLGMLREFLPTVGRMLETAQQQEATKPAQLPQNPQPPAQPATPMAFAPIQPAQVQPTPQPTPKPPENNDSMNLQYTFALQGLCSKARDFDRPNNGETYEDVALSVLSMIPNDSIDEFMTLIERPDAVDELIKYYGGVAEHRAWFENLRLALLAQFDNDEPEPDTLPHDDINANGDTKRDSGNAGDVGPNEAGSVEGQKES